MLALCGVRSSNAATASCPTFAKLMSDMRQRPSTAIGRQRRGSIQFGSRFAQGQTVAEPESTHNRSVVDPWLTVLAV